ncbi:MAG TPA: SpoIIE family protein phosphatase [Gaiellaceae bacterium]|nr:SpoIIE family protein phosphatase [Gaiellaceae bacterium]
MQGCSLVRVTESSQRGEARRCASTWAARLDFGEERAGRVAIVATELASNLLKHAPQGGQLFVGPVADHGNVGISIVAVDAGPGIADERQALEDGHSTAGSAGTGLGAVRRLSDLFELYSPRDHGTIVVSRLWREPGKGSAQVSVAGVCGMMDGESVSGDDFAIMDHDGLTRIVLADGLGHGPGAAEAAHEAIRVFEQSATQSLGGVLATMHARLRPTRGAAVALAEIDPVSRTLRYAGLGNISGLMGTRGNLRNLISHNGTVGHTARKIQEFDYELPAAAAVILHSDGITTRWNLDGYPGLLSCDPVVTAAVLYRDFNRGRDDATAVVAKVP